MKAASDSYYHSSMKSNLYKCPGQQIEDVLLSELSNCRRVWSNSVWS